LKEAAVRRTVVAALIAVEVLLFYGIVAFTLELAGDFPPFPSGTHLVRYLAVAEHSLALRLRRGAHRHHG
jgi:hypothetical protein